ncbi:MAG: alpha/beta hydrolase [Corynebacteriales bacterium]|nr:alpha/beta hydrolase [Mycobacteriales bacterium]
MIGPRLRSRRPTVDPRGFVALCGVIALVAAIAVVVALPVTSQDGRHRQMSPASAEASRTAAAPALAAMNAVTVRRYVYLDTTAGDPGQDYGDLFLPPGSHARGSLPLVVLVHGGGWNSRYGAGTFVPFARTLAARGLAVYNLEYRRLGSGGGWPTTFTDVAAGVDFVPTLLADNPAIATADSTLVGHSAGAQLAVWAGTRRPSTSQPPPVRAIWRPTRIISLAGPLNMRASQPVDDLRRGTHPRRRTSAPGAVAETEPFRAGHLDLVGVPPCRRPHRLGRPRRALSGAIEHCPERSERAPF